MSNQNDEDDQTREAGYAEADEGSSSEGDQTYEAGYAETDDGSPSEDAPAEPQDGDGYSEPLSAGGYYAACDSGPHTPWQGPNRATRSEAQDDADRHNATCPDQGAIVVS